MNKNNVNFKQGSHLFKKTTNIVERQDHAYCEVCGEEVFLAPIEFKQIVEEVEKKEEPEYVETIDLLEEKEQIIKPKPKKENIYWLPCPIHPQANIINKKINI